MPHPKSRNKPTQEHVLEGEDIFTKLPDQQRFLKIVGKRRDKLLHNVHYHQVYRKLISCTEHLERFKNVQNVITKRVLHTMVPEVPYNPEALALFKNCPPGYENPLTIVWSVEKVFEPLIQAGQMLIDVQWEIIGTLAMLDGGAAMQIKTKRLILKSKRTHGGIDTIIQNREYTHTDAKRIVGVRIKLDKKEHVVQKILNARVDSTVRLLSCHKSLTQKVVDVIQRKYQLPRHTPSTPPTDPKLEAMLKDSGLEADLSAYHQKETKRSQKGTNKSK